MKTRTSSWRQALFSTGLFLAIAAPSSLASTIVFQNGQAIDELGITQYSGTETLSLISGTNAGRNYGGGTTLYVGRSGETEERKVLLRFDVTALQGMMASVEKVTLSLTSVAVSGTTAGNIGLNLFAISEANAGWAQGTAKGAVQAGASAWNYRVSTTTAWAGSAGLGTAGADYVAGSIGGVTTVQTGSSSSTTYTWDIPISLFEQWVDGDNAGLLLSADAFATLGLQEYIGFASIFNSAEGRFPKLTVEYTPIPEPAAFLMIGLGAGALWLRGRRLQAYRCAEGGVLG